MHTVYQFKDFRIVEIEDNSWTMGDLKGDCYNSEIHNDIPKDVLKSQERQFEDKVYNEGVYGYRLEKWNPRSWSRVEAR